jgi:hypothetical protein
VKLTGRTAQKLINEGSLPNSYAYGPPAAAPRTTVRRPRSIASIFGAGAGGAAAAVRAPAIPLLRSDEVAPCPPGMNRNPSTGRCIKVGGRTYKRVRGPSKFGTSNSTTAAAAAATPLFAVAAAAPATAIRAASSEAPPHLPVGMSGVVPLGDRRSMLAWLTDNCENDRDPLTGQRFLTAHPDYLQQAIRLSNRTCTTGPALNAKVTAEHRAGDVATIPGDATSHMTLDDFKALRAAMRRREPAYKIPPRRHQPPPENWQLYVASDNRSGPEYASIMFLDVSKAERTAEGVQYPQTAVRMDLGFIPVTATEGATCSVQTLVDLIKHANEKNRLVSPVAGGWKPNAGFPFKKSYWETGRVEKLSRLCRELAIASTRPF